MNIKLESRISRRRVPLAKRIQRRRQNPQRIPTTTVKQPANRSFDEQRHGFKAYDDLPTGLRRLESDPASVVVAVDGACRNNGRAGARAGYGIFFSASAVHLNTNGIVPLASPQTSQYAELYATMQALETIHQLMIAGENISHVIVKTDSEYLSRGLSTWIWKWAVNGFLNVKGEPVVNGRAFRYLHEKVQLLEKEYDMTVSFCLVRREFNQQADRLAKSALV